MTSANTTVERSWTITTWNVQGSRRPRPTDLADVLREESPDVIAVQEIRRGTAQQVAAELHMNHTWTLKHYPFSPLFARAAEGLAILSPHEITQSGHRVVSDSRSTWTSRRRIAQWSVIGRPDASGYRIFNVHLSPGDRADQRRVEAARVAAIVAQLGEAPTAIVAGDLNDADDPTIIAALPGVEPIRPPFTNPSSAPMQTLDHVLVPTDARDISVKVPTGEHRSTLSDHLPVTVRFTMDWVTGDFV